MTATLQATRPAPAAARRRLLRPFSVLGAAWRRSIQMRVVTYTLVLSVLVVVLLGATLLQQVTDGLLRAKEAAAVADASAGLTSAQDQLDAIDDVEPNNAGELLTDLVEQLADRAGPAGLYEVVLLSPESPNATVTARSPRVTRGVMPDSVPRQLRHQVVATPSVWRTYTDIRYEDGSSEPGLVVGGQLSVPGAGIYELYYLFPLSQQQQTLTLVQQALATAGAVLVVLLGAVAWLVVRQAVTPVRMAARIAERLAAGRLEERMAVRGEDDLARLAVSFNKMASGLQRQIRQLEDLSRVQRRFVSDVSHELRTPLTTVRMAADLLHESREHFDPAVRRSAELLQTQLDRFEELLSDLLEISRFDAGAAVLDLDAVDVRTVVRRVLESLAPLAQRTGSELVLVPSAQPCVAEVDQRRIERILRNLVVNAIEHGEGREVSVEVAVDTRAVAVTVRDHGIGLRPGEAALVFNRFWRADPARARTTGGTGLGLAIALEDARLHHGWLQAWGEPGAGSQFRLTIPRRAGDDIATSLLPLVPPDASSEKVLATVGAPYRRTDPEPATLRTASDAATTAAEEDVRAR